MAAVVVRNLSEETHRALKRRASLHGKSTEAEIRAILDEAVRPEPEVGLGTALANIAKDYGGFDLDIQRDKSPTEPAIFPTEPAIFE